MSKYEPDIVTAVKRISDMAEKFSELYRSELEKEMRKSLGEKLRVTHLEPYNGDIVENHFFSVGYENWVNVGVIFPFRKKAFCGRLNFTPNDTVFKNMKNVLEGKGYSVEYEECPETIRRQLEEKSSELVKYGFTF